MVSDECPASFRSQRELGFVAPIYELVGFAIAPRDESGYPRPAPPPQSGPLDDDFLSTYLRSIPSLMPSPPELPKATHQEQNIQQEPTKCRHQDPRVCSNFPDALFLTKDTRKIPDVSKPKPKPIHAGRERERERERAGRGRFAAQPRGSFGNGSGSFAAQAAGGGGGGHYGPGGGGGAGGVGRYGAMAASAGFRGRERCVCLRVCVCGPGCLCGFISGFLAFWLSG